MAGGSLLGRASADSPGCAQDRRILDNIFWNTLTGAHARYAVGHGAARRYAPAFSPIAAFADPQRPDFAALAPYCAPGEGIYCDVWAGVAPPGWRIEFEATMFKMLWQGGRPVADEARDAIPLGPEHVPRALELAALTRPGPFGPRTIELGEYFGIFDGPRLIAMAGERTQAGRLREISGVCTHPDYQGRGLARRLMLELIRRELERAEVPFLHVLRDNALARALYARLGFQDYRETVIRVVARC